MIDTTAPLDSWLPVRWYGGYLSDLPDLCVGRWPAEFGRMGSAAWKVWVVETPAETQALTASLRRPVPLRNGALDFKAGPDAAVSAPARDGAPFVALYEPPEQGWPWITVTATQPGQLGLARGRYAYDTDESLDEALDRVSRLRAMVPGMDIRLPPNRETRS